MSKFIYCINFKVGLGRGKYFDWKFCNLVFVCIQLSAVLKKNRWRRFIVHSL